MSNSKSTEGTIYINFSKTNIANNLNEKKNFIENLIKNLESKNSKFDTEYYPSDIQLNFADFCLNFTTYQNTSFEEKIKKLLTSIGQPTAFSNLLQSIPNLQIEIDYKETNSLSINTNEYGKAAISK